MYVLRKWIGEIIYSTDEIVCAKLFDSINDPHPESILEFPRKLVRPKDQLLICPGAVFSFRVTVRKGKGRAKIKFSRLRWTKSQIKRIKRRANQLAIRLGLSNEDSKQNH